jgi:8-oxo-dGTP diphosphatase
MKHAIPPFEPTVSYVLGFAFTPSRGGVLTIRKTRPKWQAGKLNGVGGKVEEQDWCLEEAMRREFKEETNIDTDVGQWVNFGAHVRPGETPGDPHSYALHLFSTVLSAEQCQQVQLVTDEEPVWKAIDLMPLSDEGQVPGMTFYVAMALNHLGKQFNTLTIELAEQP